MSMEWCLFWARLVKFKLKIVCILNNCYYQNSNRVPHYKLGYIIKYKSIQKHVVQYFFTSLVVLDRPMDGFFDIRFFDTTGWADWFCFDRSLKNVETRSSIAVAKSWYEIQCLAVDVQQTEIKQIILKFSHCNLIKTSFFKSPNFKF